MRRALPVILLLLLCACAAEPEPPGQVQIVLERGEGFTAEEYVRAVPCGADAVFDLTLEPGYTVAGADRAEKLRQERTEEP